MGKFSRLIDFLGLGNDSSPAAEPSKSDSEQEYQEDEWLNEEKPMYPPKQLHKGQAPNNLVQLQSIKTMQNSKLVLMEPHTYEETQDMADHLRTRKIIIVNLQRLPHEQAKRTVDFLSGTVYAIGGSIHKLGNNIFLCTADNVEIQGAISDLYEEI